MANTPLTSIPLPVAGGTDQVPTDLATALKFVEQHIVMTFATASARTTAFTGAGITPVAGMLSYLTTPGRYERYSGSAWVALIQSTLSPDVSAIKGTNWDGVSPLINYRGRAQIVVGASSQFTVNLPAAFPNGLLTAALSAGDNASVLGFVVPVIGNHTLSSLGGGAFTQSAGGVGSGSSIVVNYDAIGW